MKIKHFDRPTIKHLRPVIEKALNEALTSYGISVTLGNAKFSPASMSIKVEMATVAEDGTVKNPQYEALVSLGHFYGLPESFDINTLVGGYKLVGLNTKSHKYPFIAEKNGKRYKMAVAHIRTMMGFGPVWED